MFWVFLLLLNGVAEPPAFESAMREGLAALERSDLASARNDFERASRFAPSSAATWFLLAQTYARQSDMQAAAAAAAKAAQFAGKDPTILYNLAVFYRDAGQAEESIGLAKRALTVENSVEVRTLLGNAYTEKRDWPHAISEFKEALRLAPYSEQAIFNLAQAHLQSQDFPGAVAVLEEGRKTFDKSPQIELSLGVAYYGQRRFADAVDRYLRVMELAPDIPQPYYFVGRILEHALDRIPVVVQRAISFEQQHPRIPLGYVLHAKAIMLQLPSAGYPPEAQQAFALLERADAMESKQAEVRYLLGTLLERKQAYSDAAAMLERSIELDPRGAAAHFRLARVYERLGRREDAAAQRALHEKLSAEEGSLKVR